MHYIRYLSSPKIHVKGSDVQLKAVIAVTTDLGETFYPHDLDLIVSLRSPTPDAEGESEVYLRRKIQCPAYTRALPIRLNLTRNDVDWPACLHVSVAKPTTSRNPGFLPSVVDIWSSPLNPTKGHFGSGPRIVRRFTPLNERPLTLIEESGDSIARHLWDGSQVLVQLIDQTINLDTSSSPLPLLEYVLISATYRRMHVLELGCGVGTVGLSIAQSIPDTDIILTDLSDVQELVEANIARLKPAINSKVSFLPLDWQAPVPQQVQSRSHDLIIVSECTYNTATLPALISTLLALLVRSPKAVVLVATKRRHPDEAVFFDLMQNAGLVLDCQTKVPLPGVMGEGYADAESHVGAYCYVGRGHRLSLSPRGSEGEVQQSGGAGRGRGRGKARDQT
nr:hypothetical protein B0A51_04636 [Rachicladosporium sp. CCFEE 5018]